MIAAKSMRCGILLLAVCAPLACSPERADEAPVVAVLEPGLRLRVPTDFPLTSVRRIAESVGGSIVLVDGQTQGLLQFDEEGDFVAFHGGEGEGPGEFTSVFTAGFVGEHPWGVDARQRRAHVFGHSLETRSISSGAADAVPFGLSGAYTLYAAQTDDAFEVRAQGRDGASELLRVDTPERQWSVIPNGTSSLTQPFVHYPLVRAWEGGLVVVRRGVLESGRFGYSVTWVEPTGEEYAVEVETVPRAVSDADVDRALDLIRESSLPAMLVGVGQFGSEAEVLASAREQLVVPAHLPPIEGGVSGMEARSVQVAPSGEVWLALWDDEVGATDQLWQVVSRTGVGRRVHVADSIRVAGVGADHVWGVTLDAFDVPTVTKFRVTAPVPAPR